MPDHRPLTGHALPCFRSPQLGWRVGPEGR